MIKNKVGTDKVFFKNKHKLAWRKVDEQLIVLYLPESKLYRINPMGDYIWSRLDSQRKINEIIEDIRSEFDIDSKSELEKDVVEFIENLIQYNIITAV